MVCIAFFSEVKAHRFYRFACTQASKRHNAQTFTTVKVNCGVYRYTTVCAG